MARRDVDAGRHLGRQPRRTRSRCGRCRRSRHAVGMNVMRELVGVDFPLFAFSHCRDVVAAVSRAGGFGVLGGASFTPESLEVELAWIDDHVDGRPYGVDILVPEHQFATGGATIAQLAEQLPDEHRRFVTDLLSSYDVQLSSTRGGDGDVQPATTPEMGQELM